MHQSELQRCNRVVYAKGGRAVEEANRLFPTAGSWPINGPDQFLLSARYAFSTSQFRLVSVGPNTLKRQWPNGDAIEYGIRPLTSSGVMRQIAQLTGIARFVAETLSWRPTLVLAGIEGSMALASLLVARLSRSKLIFLVHTDLQAASLSRLKLAINRYVLKGADTVVVHGPFLRDQMVKMGCKAEKLLEFDTGFDPSAQLQEASDQHVALMNSTFLYAGRVEENKGVFDLLCAFESVAEQCDANLIFAGDGGDLKALKAKAASSRFASRISIRGSVPHSQLLLLMKHSVATVTPTHSTLSEGRCMSALESLLVGTPVLAPQIGAFPYLVKDGDNGLLYTPDSVSELAQAIVCVATDAALLTRLRAGAEQSGKALMQPERTFLQCLIEATR